MMGMGEDDLGLSLSLSFPALGNSRDGRVGLGDGHPRHHHHHHHHHNHHHRLQQRGLPSHQLGRPFGPSSGSAASLGMFTHRRPHQNEGFPPLERNTESIHGEHYPSLKGIDVNQIPCTDEDGEDEPGISSPNSTVSSISGNKRGERDAMMNGEEHEIERACSQGMSDEDDGGGDGSRKKLRLSKDQAAILEETFREHCTLNPKQKVALAKQLGLRQRQVEVWFQNRRARTKLKQTEVDCELLRRCCEKLTDENQRLQKEVQELRALKLSPQFYMQMTPPTTLTMCPSCERVGLPSSSSAAPLRRAININLSPAAQSGTFGP
ncbi:hypothetical protein MLD38_038921 [Melastoma candidum]|uniref:Uncharacterized protein n=1 Tax=Melastoma candidum TaxID=119954 RepID=A0ACB9L1H0_9MYRT|nr:hypothetical protein MLD38_038921 [Melastoma candidum]